MKLTNAFSAFISALLLTACGSSSDTISLAGKWNIDLDRNAEGVLQKWYDGHEYDMTINLPSTTDLAGIGDEPPACDINSQWTFGWRRQTVYAGVAWYEREVEIPAAWEGKHIELFLEQLRSESEVWVDGKKVPEKEISLVTSHTHDLTAYLTPGKHRITIKLDNANMHNIQGSYARSEMGQGNWQGIVGDIELRASDPVYVDHVRFETVNPSVAEVKVEVANETGSAVKVEGTVELLDEGKVVASAPLTLFAENDLAETSVILDVEGLTMWSEFHPHLYDLRVKIGDGDSKDEYMEKVGLRILSRNENHQLVVNGNEVFLRGTLNYNIFPLTGHASVDFDEWMKVFQICKDWGLNHIRFHSLTPPEEAFDAADRLGLYIQCECPKAGIMGQNIDDDNFLIYEGKKIIRDLGNHPSFIMLSVGNELSGPDEAIRRVYDAISSTDDRFLYAASTGGVPFRAIGGQYRVYGSLVRGLKGPYTDWDYNETLEKIGELVISHETGQWHCYPSMKVIPKYKGAMQPDNLEIIQKDLEKKGLTDKAELFTQVSGAFQTELYKEELEALFRTRNMGGFQMHNLNDFPAQGTATSGFLDIFFDEKGYVNAERFREFVAPVVPLARMAKRTYTNSETFKARVDLANYLEKPIENGKLKWTICNGQNLLAEGELVQPVFENGNVYEIGEISTSLATVEVASKLELLIEVEGTEYRNRWNFWVYPDHQVKLPAPTVKISENWSETKALLEKGEKVLFLPDLNTTRSWRPGEFLTIYWSPVWMSRRVETMSVLADTDHPALKGFPTDIHSDWQWFDVLENSFAMGIDPLPLEFEPVVGVVDSYRKNQRLANLFEAQVGNGKLMVSSINFLNGLDKDLARCNLRNSVLEYMASDAFQPSQHLDIKNLDEIFIPDVKVSTEEFPELADAAIRVKAESPFVPDGCRFNFNVNSPIVKSGNVTAWVNKKDIWITLNAPEALDGTLYLFMRNTASKQWGFLKTVQEQLQLDYVIESKMSYGNKSVGPVSTFIVNGKVLDTVYNFGAGKWYALPVTAEQMKSGIYRLQISTLNHPNIISEMAFVPAEKM